MKINKIELKAKRAKRFYGWHLLPPTYSQLGGGGRRRGSSKDGRR